MVTQKLDMRGAQEIRAPKEQMASPSQARSVVALYLAAGATPEEIDGAVAVQIDLAASKLAPTTYADVANHVIEALAEYRHRQQTYTVVEESNA